MKKCSKVKNPCKICLQPVTNKNGIQCKGACKKWAHFTCLNYTPGKIQDIKAGIITITCPCPNCNIADEPKEFLTNPPFTCDNQKCPANLQPKCDSQDCPVNKERPIPPMPQGQATPPMPPFSQPYQDQKPCFPQPPCEKSAGRPPQPMRPARPQQSPSPNRPPNIPLQSSCDNNGPPSGANTDSTPTCESSNSASKTPSIRLPSKCSLKRDSCFGKSDDADSIPKSASCSVLCPGRPKDVDLCPGATNPTPGTDCKLTSSDSKLLSSKVKLNEKTLLCTIHELCSTVGHLSQQIKYLMSRMIHDLNEDNAC